MVRVEGSTFVTQSAYGTLRITLVKNESTGCVDDVFITGSAPGSEMECLLRTLARLLGFIMKQEKDQGSAIRQCLSFMHGETGERGGGVVSAIADVFSEYLQEDVNSDIHDFCYACGNIGTALKWVNRERLCGRCV